MVSRKNTSLYIKPGFLISEIIIYNAVLLTALLLFYSIPLSAIQTRFIFLIYNAAIFPSIKLIMPVVKERTLYIDRVILLTFKSIVLHAFIFIALIRLTGIDILSSSRIGIIYLSLLLSVTVYNVLFRLVLKHFRNKGLNCVSVIIIGSSETALQLFKSLKKNYIYGYHIAGQVCNANLKFNGVEWLGEIDDLDNILERNEINEIYYADSNDNPETVGKIMGLAEKLHLKFYFVPMLSRWSGRKFHTHSVGNGLFSLSILQSPLDKSTNKIIKRCFDIVFSSVCLVINLPLFAVIAILIKIDSDGPVFFKQKRNGYMGKEFDCWKFRSMVPNNKSDAVATRKDDSRVTRIGKILRCTSLDELPQFWNVLMGDMSVVGPRPHMVSQTENYSKVLSDYMIRHMVKPGITGWSQINGLRGTATHISQMRNRVEHDIWYMDNWTLVLDAKIIARTIFNLIFLQEENAY